MFFVLAGFCCSFCLLLQLLSGARTKFPLDPRSHLNHLKIRSLKIPDS